MFRSNKTAQDAAFALPSKAWLSQFQSGSVQVWYRLFRYTHGEHYGDHLMPLGRGYFIDLDDGTIAGLVASCEKLQSRSPAMNRHLARLRFYQRWLDPVIRVPLLVFLPRCRSWIRQRKNQPTIQRLRPAHSHFPLSTSNREDVSRCSPSNQRKIFRRWPFVLSGLKSEIGIVRCLTR